MNLDKFTDLLLEGGKAVGEVSRVSRENVDPTLEAFNKKVLSKIGITNFRKIGSTGKKSSSGDLDIAVELPEDLDYREVHSQIQQMGYEVSKASPTTISVKFPIYDSEGKTNEWAQVDLMFGKADWLEFGYYAPGEDESKYTGAHRNFLLAAIIRYARELKGKEGKTWAIDLNRGLNRKTRGTKTTKTGKEKEVTLAKTLITQRPEKVVELLNITTSGDWQLSDLKAPFEHLWQKTKKAFPEDVLDKIREYVSGASKSSKKEEPVMEQLIMRLREEVLNKANEKAKIKKSIKDYFGSMGYNIKAPGSRLKPDLRIDVSGNPDNTRNLLTKVLNDLGYSNYNIEIIGPNENYEAKSGTFYTFKMEIDDVIIYLVDSSDKDSKIGRKQLSPNRVIKTGKEYKTGQLYNEIISFIQNESLDENIKKYLKYLMDLIKKFNGFSDEVPSSATYTIQKDDSEFNVSDSEKPRIFNDFGEILCAYFLGRLTGDRVKFPKDSNNPIADFSVLDKNDEFGTPVSVKNESGAKASLKGLLNDEDFYKSLSDEMDDNQYKVIEIIKESKSVLHSFLRLAEHYNAKSFKELENRIGNINLNSSANKIKQQMYDWLDDQFTVDDTEEKRQALFNSIREYAHSVGYGQTMKLEEKYNPLSDKRFGVLIYPLYVEITKKLEDDNRLKNSIKKAVNKLEAKQINIYNKSNFIEFKITSFGDIDFKFEQGNISAWNPLNSNITFKLYQN